MERWLEEKMGYKISRDKHNERRFEEEVETDKEWESYMQGRRHY